MLAKHCSCLSNKSPWACQALQWSQQFPPGTAWSHQFPIPSGSLHPSPSFEIRPSTAANTVERLPDGRRQAPPSPPRLQQEALHTRADGPHARVCRIPGAEGRGCWMVLKACFFKLLEDLACGVVRLELGPLPHTLLERNKCAAVKCAIEEHTYFVARPAAAPPCPCQFSGWRRRNVQGLPAAAAVIRPPPLPGRPQCWLPPPHPLRGPAQPPRRWDSNCHIGAAGIL